MNQESKVNSPTRSVAIQRFEYRLRPSAYKGGKPPLPPSSLRQLKRKSSLSKEVVYTFVYHLRIAGFDWDDGNWPKCGKHGVSREEIEQVLLGTPVVMAAPHPDEARMQAIGKTEAGRYVFLVFTLRKIDGKTKLRPISARHMHQKEINHYERQT